jgi:uncharacterized protein (TIGR03067 family)
MKRKLALLLTAALLLAADSPKDGTGKKDADKFQGGWTTASLEFNGEQYDSLAKQLRCTFKGNTVTVQGDDEVLKDYPTLTFKLEPSTTPKQVDMTVKTGLQKDAVLEGIYELKDDELRICVRVFGKDRPTEFTSPSGESIALLVLKREKP